MKKILALLIVLTLITQIIPVFGLAAHMSRSTNDAKDGSGPNLDEMICPLVVEGNVAKSEEKAENPTTGDYSSSPCVNIENLTETGSCCQTAEVTASASFSRHAERKDEADGWNPVNPRTIGPELALSADDLLVESATLQPASSSTTLFTEGFEGSFPSTNWWVGDDDSRNGADYWDDTSHRARSGSWSGWCADIGSKPDGTPNPADWTYDDYMAAYLSRQAGAPFDARNWDIAFLTYYVWYDIESGYDELDLSVTGDGVNWGGIFQYDSNSLTSGDWVLDGSSGGVFDYRVGRVPESTSAGSVYTSSFNIGFYFQSDGSIHKEGAYLDDLSFKVYDITSPYVSVSKTVASPGDTIQLGYKIDNISPFDLKIWLGATLTDEYGNQINDPANDVIVTVTPGYRYYYRDFHIPSSANPGTYDITYALWSGWTSPIDQSRQWWTWTWNDVLTVEVNHDPILSDGYVDPRSGYRDTGFLFLVKYRDQDGDPADTRRLILDDDGIFYFDMEHVVGNPIDGEWFGVRVSGLHLDSEVGEHRFFFYFTDGEGGEDYDPDEGWHPGPIVEPMWPDIWVDPTSLVFEHPSVTSVDIPHAYSARENSEKIPGEVVVGFNSSSFVTCDTVNATIEKYGAKIVALDKVLNFTTVRLHSNDTASMHEFMTYMHNLAFVTYVEQSGYSYTTLTPNDPRYEQQWGPQKIKAPAAWDVELGKSSVTVAVVDTGVDYNHEDLSDRFGSIKGRDINDDDDDPMPDPVEPTPGGSWHGTLVAGIIAATINNDVGIAGIAQVTLLAVKVQDGRYGSPSHVAQGIRWAADNGADIISISLSMDSYEFLRAACEYAMNKGALIIAASGNDDGSVRYPAAYDTVIAVGATDESDRRWYDSNYGPELELTAPGDRILTTTPNDGYIDTASGTSLAAPHVSGVAALVLSRNSELTNEQVRGILDATADDLGDLGRDDFFGYGRVDAQGAVESAVPSQEITVGNSGIADLHVSSISSSQPWLSASPQGFTVVPSGTQIVTVSVDPAGKTPGTYVGRLNINSDDPDESPFPIEVTLVIRDVNPPETTISSGPSGTISYNDVSFSWTGSDDVTPTSSLAYSYYLVGYDPDWSTWTSDTSKQYHDLPDNDYTFKVKAKDQAGNVDPTPAERSFTVDTTAPTIVDHTPTGTEVPITTTITVTFSEAMDHASAENSFSIDPSVSGSFSWSGNIMTFTPDSDLAYDTTYELTIDTEAMDSAGNPLESPYSWEFTTTTPPNKPPSILDIYPDSETEYQGNTIRIFCDSSDPETPESALTCKIWIRSSGDPWVVSGEIMSWDENNHYYDWNIPTSAKLGDYDVNCTVSDGELSDWRMDYNEFEVVDTTPPLVQITNPTTLSPTYIQSGTTITVDYTYTELNPKNATIRVHNATHIIGETIVTDLILGVDVMRSDPVNIAAWAMEGAYNVIVTLYDVADQTGTDTQRNAVIIDNTPPLKTVVSPLPGSHLDFSTVWINETLSDAASGIDPLTITMTLNGTAVTPDYDPSTGLLSYHAIGLDDGNHTVAVSVRDLAGNLAINSWWFIVDIEGRVHISVSAYANPALIGFRVRITGSVTWEQSGSGIPNAPVLLSCRYHSDLLAYIPSEKAWKIISTVITDVDGSYSVTWFVLSSGYYVVEAFYPGGSKVQEATSSTNLLIASSDDRVFSVSSNSTVSAMNLNSTTRELTFTVSGHSGTTGYLHMFLAKSLIPDVSELKIYFDGVEKSYESIPVDDTWFIRLAYTHSTHTVKVSLGSALTTLAATAIHVPLSSLLLAVLAAIAILPVILIYRTYVHAVAAKKKYRVIQSYFKVPVKTRKPTS